MTDSNAGALDVRPSDAEVEKRTKDALPTKSIGGFVPKTFPELKEMSAVLANSNLVPKELRGKPADVMICVMHGLEVGVTPAQALSNIMVVNGRPAIWGDLALGIVRRSQMLADFNEDAPDKALEQGFGRCWAKRANGEEREYKFSIEDATKARLINKQGPWQEYRGRMLQMRARSWVLRDLFGDILKGLAIIEEQRDVPRDVTERAAAAPMPKAVDDKSQKKPEPEKKKPEAEKPKDETPAEMLIAEFVPAAVAKTTLGGKQVFSIRRTGDNKRFFSESEAVAKLARKAAADKKKIRVSYEEGDDKVAHAEQVELI